MATAYQSTASSGLSHVRAAVVQAAPVLFEPRRVAPEARRPHGRRRPTGAELVVFPEAFIAGYPRDTISASASGADPEGRDEFRRLFENAIDVPGPATEVIGSVGQGLCRPSRRRRRRAGRRDPLLHGPDLRARRPACSASTAS